MDSQWLKTQLTLNPDKSKAGLAKAINLDPPAVSKILNGTRQIKAQEYILMREFFGMPVDGHSSLARGPSGEQAITGEKNGLSEGTVRIADTDWAIPPALLNPGAASPPEKVRVFHVRDTAMEPEFLKDEQVLVDTSDKNPAQAGVFLVSDGFGNMLRHCAAIPKSDPPEIKISASATGFQPQTLKLGDFLIVGRIIAKLQMI